MSTELATTPETAVVSTRATYVRDRLSELNKSAGELLLESGVLLQEIKLNGMHKEWGYKSFDACIQALHDAGELSFGPRNARNMIAVVEMIQRQGYDAKAVGEIPISKLREIATIADPGLQKELMEHAGEMSTGEVQAQAKRIRDAAAGRTTDPLVALKVTCSSTQLAFYKECLGVAKVVGGINDDAPDSDALEAIMADWRSGVDLPDITEPIDQDDASA